MGAIIGSLQETHDAAIQAASLHFFAPSALYARRKETSLASWYHSIVDQFGLSHRAAKPKVLAYLFLC